MTQKIIVCRGVPCSGKTTWAEGFVKKNPDFVNLNRDDLRNMLFGPEYLKKGNFSRKKERLVTQQQLSMARVALEEGKSIVVSDTNLNPQTVKRWEDLADDYNIHIEIKDFEISLKEALRRNELRENGIPSKVIKRMYWKHKAEAEEGFKLEQDATLSHAVVFDIDGTLADHSGIRSPYDYSRVKDDKLHADIKHLLDLMYSQGYDIIIMTGRDGICRADTEEWLNQHGIRYHMLLQRAEGDSRPDYVIKQELFDNHVRDKWYVAYVFDDRDQVVQLWRGMGLRCLQVNYGDF